MRREIIRKDEPGVAGLSIVVEADPVGDDPFTLSIDLYRWPKHNAIQMWEVCKHYHLDDGIECAFSPTGHCAPDEQKEYRQYNIWGTVSLFGWKATVNQIIQEETGVEVSAEFRREVYEAVEWLANTHVQSEAQ